MSTGRNRGFQVESDELRSFANGLADRKGQIDGAADKVGGVALGSEAFGVLFGFFAGDVDAKAQEMTDNIKQLASAVDRSVEDLKAAADEYDRNDDENRQRFNELGGQ